MYDKGMVRVSKSNNTIKLSFPGGKRYILPNDSDQSKYLRGFLKEKCPKGVKLFSLTCFLFFSFLYSLSELMLSSKLSLCSAIYIKQSHRGS